MSALMRRSYRRKDLIMILRTTKMRFVPSHLLAVNYKRHLTEVLIVISIMNDIRRKLYQLQAISASCPMIKSRLRKNED